jgi:dipeptidyl aminopeptidase/acylaminoacyl peptidase
MRKGQTHELRQQAAATQGATKLAHCKGLCDFRDTDAKTKGAIMNSIGSRVRCLLVPLLFLLIAARLGAQERAQSQPAREPASLEAVLNRLAAVERQLEQRSSTEESLAKQIDDLLWYNRVGDICTIDKVAYTGPPPRVIPNPTAQGAGNPLTIYAYAFIPKTLDRSKKHPLIVLVHGGVHSNFSSNSAHIVRELIEQGYAVIASDYRGSTGYGRGFWRQIDYGGREIDDVHEGKKWMLETYGFLDPQRVGIMGWSHGGLITLLNIFEHPADYKVAYAGVPVSDLVARMGYKSQSYRELFSASYHIGKTAEENVNEYRRRSPAWNAEKLQTPLLIHTNTNDEDVNVLEVEHLIKALKAAGKQDQVEYKIYQNAPGGHSFNRNDTKLARESRQEIYKFLARHLNPISPPK